MEFIADTTVKFNPGDLVYVWLPEHVIRKYKNMSKNSTPIYIYPYPWNTDGSRVLFVKKKIRVMYIKADNATYSVVLYGKELYGVYNGFLQKE